jgi:hypothetical protein
MSPVSMRSNAGRSKPGEETTLGILIERAHKAHPDSTKDAAKALEEMVLVNEEIFFEVMKPHVGRVCYDLLRDGTASRRGAIWKPTGSIVANSAPARALREGVVALATSNLLLFPLPGGQRLGEASRADVAGASDFYGKQAKDMSHKSRWLTLIAQSLGDGEKVSDKFTEERLAELKREAEHAA